MNSHLSDFTIEHYSNLLRLVISKYRIIGYNQVKYYENENYCLWRHDVDFSINNAVYLSKLESKLGIKSTYFFQLSSKFYNIFDPNIIEKLKEIRENGHSIGLHFYPLVYKISNESIYKEKLNFEKTILEKLIESEVNSFSLHNPTEKYLNYNKMEYQGMINAYSSYLRNKVAYSSDSNGYWRYNRLEDFIKEGNDRVQILTHPVWWTEDILSPRNKVKREIENNSKAILDWYDKTLAYFGRSNF